MKLYHTESTPQGIDVMEIHVLSEDEEHYHLLAYNQKFLSDRIPKNILQELGVSLTKLGALKLTHEAIAQKTLYLRAQVYKHELVMDRLAGLIEKEKDKEEELEWGEK